MKRYLVLLGAVILVMALASPSLAQFKSYGHVEVGTYWLYNQGYFDKDRGDDNKRGFMERFRFYLEYGDPKTVRAVLGFEADSEAYGTASYNQGGYSGVAPGGVSGNQFNFRSTRIGGPTAANGNNMGASNTDQLSVEVKHAYLDFVIPSTPVNVTAGLQFFGIGGPLANFLMSTDLAAIKATANFAPHAVEAFYAPQYKGNLAKDNDGTLMGLRYLLKQPTANVEAFFIYDRDRRTQTESWTWTGTAAGTATNYTLTQTLTPRDYDYLPWWVGFWSSFVLGNFTIEPLAIYEGGYARKYFQNNPTTGDVKISAYELDLNLKYQIGPGLLVGVEGFYASGGDTDKTDKYNAFQFTPGSESGWGFGNGKSVFYFGNGDFQYYGYRYNAAYGGGVWFGRANVEFSPLAWLRLQANYLYIGDTSKGSLAVQPATGVANNTGYLVRTDKDVDTIGQEINLITTFKIYQNLTYMVGAAYFITGDAFKGSIPGARLADSPGDNAWNILTNLKYAF
jgi:hypothetical protein